MDSKYEYTEGTHHVINNQIIYQAVKKRDVYEVGLTKLCNTNDAVLISDNESILGKPTFTFYGYN